MSRLVAATCLAALLASCAKAPPPAASPDPAAVRLTDREAIESPRADPRNRRRPAGARARPTPGRSAVDIHTSAIGRHEDELEKRDGAWLITKRRRSE